MDGLVLDDGSPVHLDAFRGEVVLVYFGYLSCPDVCPTTLATAADAIDSVGAADDVTLLMVSVDPARDSLDEIGDYVRHFHPSFAGVGGPEPAVADAATLYGIFYELGDPDDNGDYDVAHTAGLLGIDRDGNLAVRWGPDVGTDALAADLREMLR
jgi:protein SCO1/2